MLLLLLLIPWRALNLVLLDSLFVWNKWIWSTSHAEKVDTQDSTFFAFNTTSARMATSLSEMLWTVAGSDGRRTRIHFRETENKRKTSPKLINSKMTRNACAHLVADPTRHHWFEHRSYTLKVFQCPGTRAGPFPALQLILVLLR